MITYTEKGYAVHEAIFAAGHWLMEQDGVWVADDEVAVQAIIDSYTLDEAKRDKCAQVLAKAKSLRDKVIASVSMGEMASWPIKRAEAIRYATEGDAGSYPMLSMEAQVRAISLADLVTKVNANAARFAAAEAAIGGTDGRHRDAITALDSFEAVVAYDFHTGWPEV